MEIYGVILSPFVARAVIAARHKGIKHSLVMPKDGMKSPAFLKINPLGKMPALKDGKLTLFESSAIVEYLEAKSKRKPLLPESAKAAAKVRLIAAVFAEYIQMPAFRLFGQLDPAKRDQAVVDTTLAEVAKGLDVVEAMLGKPYAAGKFSLADCYAIPTLFYLDVLMPLCGSPKSLGERPKLNAYRARLAKDKFTRDLLTEMDEAYKSFMASLAQRQAH
jgi:glutathione S-transferase